MKTDDDWWVQSALQEVRTCVSSFDHKAKAKAVGHLFQREGRTEREREKREGVFESCPGVIIPRTTREGRADGDGEQGRRELRKKRAQQSERRKKKRGMGGWRSVWNQPAVVLMAKKKKGKKGKPSANKLPPPPGITNVIIWTGLLIKMCRGVEEPAEPNGERERDRETTCRARS